MHPAPGCPVSVAARRKHHCASCVNASVGDQGPRKNSGSHIDASHSRQPLVKGERLVRHEVNAVMLEHGSLQQCKVTSHISYSSLCGNVFCSKTAGSENRLLPQRVCCPQRCAMPVQHAKVSEQAQEDTSPVKNICDKQVSSWRHISCHTDKNRYYT